MALGRRATEHEFLKEYYNQEGQSFKTVLQGTNFAEFMRKLPDVCRIGWTGNEVYVERVSDENTRHMDKLTVVKKKKKLNPPR